MVRLYIQEREVELDESVQFAITKQFEDISNPTSIINTWSKSIDIPFTEKNNQLFGNLFDPDRQVISGNVLTGMYFDPHKKIDFRLDWGDNVLLSGYLKVNEIKQNNGKGSYNVTLFGELGKLFDEFKKITMDLESDVEDKYKLDTSKYVDEELDARLVYSSWNSNGQITPDMLDSAGRKYTFTNYVGFAPNNSKNEGFDYDSYQSKINTINTFKEVLEKKDFVTKTGVSIDTALQDGISQRGIGEYRSYLQLPYVYWNKLFRMFVEKAEALTGYSFVLDSDWFNTSNPYWYKLVYMLQNFHYDETDDFDIPKAEAKQRWSYNSFSWSGENFDYSAYQENEIIPTSGSGFTFNEKSKTVYFKCDISLERNRNANPNWRIANDNAFCFEFNIKTEDGAIHNFNEGLMVVSEGSTVGVKSDPRNVFVGTAVDGNIVVENVVIAFPLDEHYYNSHQSFTVECYVSCLYDKYPITNDNGEKLVTYVYYRNPIVYVAENYPNIGSGMEFTINKVWNNEYNLFEEILKYCKMYRLGFFVDEYKKTITIQPIRNYFDGYTVEDWTNKIDKSKDYIVKPITFDDKYILFNTADSETKIGKNYKERFGLNYGNYRLISDYNFNDNTKELFNEIPTSILYTPNVLGWESLYTDLDYIYTIPNESFVHCSDDDGKNVSCFGQFYFHNGLRPFDKGKGLNRDVIISDDTDFQKIKKIHTYTQSSSDTSRNTNYYPSLVATINYGGISNACIYFNKPKEKYTYDLMNNYDYAHYIYNDYWKSYIDERYNVQNKIITCYVKLTPLDWNSFSFRKFVMVGNQLCMVNKIYDYNIDDTQTTKVDLITINNISGYTN